MAVTNSLAASNGSKPKAGITAYLSSNKVTSMIINAVGEKESQKFKTAIISSVNATPSLIECDNSSILCAALLGISLKLSPSPQLGHFYMVPYNDKKSGTKKASFQMGYKGYIQLALRSGQYKKLNVQAVKEGELISYNPFEEDIELDVIKDPDERARAKTVGYYAFFEYVNGFRKAIYWTKEQMLAHADKYSQAFSRFGCDVRSNGTTYKKVSYADYEAKNYNFKDEWLYSSFWYKNFDAMAYKTMLRHLISKWGIMSIEMQSAMESDMGVIDESGSVDYVDNATIIDMETVPESYEQVVEQPERPVEEPSDAAGGNAAAAALFG